MLTLVIYYKLCGGFINLKLYQGIVCLLSSFVIGISFYLIIIIQLNSKKMKSKLLTLTTAALALLIGNLHSKEVFTPVGASQFLSDMESL
jgi:hypothetical protein